ncbi:lysozyme family protein, partial [Bacillus thuringiensis]|uniref:lysozyme family protein n=1 Tax=Bacillus thuringiensis TaxID=1428 RepID=UPI003BFA6C36
MIQQTPRPRTHPIQTSQGPFNTNYSKKPNSITHPHYSISPALQQFKHPIQTPPLTTPPHIHHIKTPLQPYNFPTPFFHFLPSNPRKYTKQIPIKFSQQQYKKLPHTPIYHSLTPQPLPYQPSYAHILYLHP